MLRLDQVPIAGLMEFLLVYIVVVTVPTHVRAVVSLVVLLTALSDPPVKC